MRIPQAVKTKCVMGELTLGDVMNLINSRFSYVCVTQDEISKGRYDSWSITKKNRLVLYQDFTTLNGDFSFDLKSKVSIKNDGVEWEDDGVKTCLQFLETKVIGLDDFLPGKKK